MSHIVQIKTQVRDATAARAASQRLGLPEPVHETVELFSGQATGLAVRLPGWTYPAVFDLAGGNATYDNFGGHWGDEREMAKFLQMYAVERAKIEARKQGHSVTEQPLADGSIKLTIQVAGGAV